MLVFSDVQSYEKTCYCYSLYPCLCSVSFVKVVDILCDMLYLVIIYVYTLFVVNVNLKKSS